MCRIQEIIILTNYYLIIFYNCYLIVISADLVPSKCDNDNSLFPSCLPGVVPDEDDIGDPGDPVEPGQLPLPVNVDAATLDVVWSQ